MYHDHSQGSNYLYDKPGPQLYDVTCGQTSIWFRHFHDEKFTNLKVKVKVLEMFTKEQ